MLCIRWKREGVVGGGAASEEEDEVAGVLAEVGVGDTGGGNGSEEVEVRGVGTGARVQKVVAEGRRAAEEAREKWLHCGGSAVQGIRGFGVTMGWNLESEGWF